MYCKQSCFDRAVNKDGYLLRYDGTDCSIGWPNLTAFDGYVCYVEEGVGGIVKLMPASAGSAEDACDDSSSFFSTSPSVIMVNPSIWFANSSLYTDVTGTLTFTTAAVQSTIHEAGDIVSLSQTDDSCSLAFFSSILYNGKFYLNDPRMDYLENTVENPAVYFGETCPTVRRSFVNEASCKLVKTCMPLAFGKSIFKLSKESLALIHEKVGAYVYSINALRTDTSPCGMLARWIQRNCTVDDCTISTLSASDETAIQVALERESGALRDVEADCDPNAVAANVVVALQLPYIYFPHTG
jgi:hypothetical protein